MKIRYTLVCLALLAASSVQAQKKKWVSLFNGKDINDWIVKIHHHDVNVNYGNTFRVEDGMIKVRYDQYDHFNEQYGHLYYKTPFSHYHLVIEYKFADPWRKDAPSYTILNSGVMFHSQDPRTMPKEQDWPISIEMQFLAGLGDGKPRPTGNMCSPGTNIVYKGKLDKRHCIDSNSKTYGKDEWVRAELIVLGDSLVKHIINGETVLEYSKPQIGGDVANRYDPAQKVDGKILSSGFIALQSEGQPIDFRKVEIMDLSEGKEDKK
ncbi:3-keto-disaccharide hydrolase [Siphonobacter sp.]|uniref:3-keto-disaccharide hydrolase n=1 Tax=Siphonobacter sp. TaxID=1869184 RepID=UPI003B3A967B